MNVFTKSEYGLQASPRPADHPEREPAIKSAVSAYDYESCEFEPARVIKTAPGQCLGRIG